jgi:hypothetical protein
MDGPTRLEASVSFNHALIRLQGELSRDTSSELLGLIESNALGGAVPLPASSYFTLPPV